MLGTDGISGIFSQSLSGDRFQGVGGCVWVPIRPVAIAPIGQLFIPIFGCKDGYCLLLVSDQQFSGKAPFIDDFTLLEDGGNWDECSAHVHGSF